MARTQAELASRIENAKFHDPEGRYDFASKVEVKAFFKQKWEQLEFDMKKVPSLEARIAELELSTWARIKRWFKKTFGGGGSMGLRPASTYPQPKTKQPMLTGEALAEALRMHADKQGGVAIKQGEAPQVLLSETKTGRLQATVEKK